MTGKTMYWIADADGTRAVVEGTDERDRWVRLRGWTESAEPDRHDFVWLRNEHPDLGACRMTWEAAQLDAWAGRGWTPGAPPEPGGPTVAPAPEPVEQPKSSPAKASATSGDSKEKVNG